MAVQLPSPRGTFPGRTSQAAKRKGTLVALTKPQQGSWSALSFCISGCSRSVVMSCFAAQQIPTWARDTRGQKLSIAVKLIRINGWSPSENSCARRIIRSVSMFSREGRPCKLHPNKFLPHLKT